MTEYHTLGFSFFVQTLREGLDKRITQFEEANALSQIEAQKSSQEWMEFYRKWSQSQRNDLLQLVTNYLHESTFEEK